MSTYSKIGINSFDAGVIESERKTNWGDWSNWESCPSGSFVKRFKRRFGGSEYVNGVSDSFGLMDITFTCSDASNTQIKGALFSSSVTAFSDLKNCPNFVRFKGFSIDNPGILNNGNEIGANGINMMCEDNTEIYSDTVFKKWRLCPDNSFICGLRVQIKVYQGNASDDTALNNIDMKCCYPVNAV